MKRSVCRIGDTGTGTCYLHDSPQNYTTTFYEGDSILSSDGIGVVLVGHHGHASCGHDTIAVTGSTYTDINGIKIHRVGDSGHIVGSEASTYTVNAGSPTSDML